MYHIKNVHIYTCYQSDMLASYPGPCKGLLSDMATWAHVRMLKELSQVDRESVIIIILCLHTHIPGL